jgi:hypothetical protein
VLPDNAILGTGTNDWACTKDNKTGLIWEIKTTDSGIRDMSQKYTNWFAGETGYGLSGNSDYFANAVNKQTLCGASNWRLPTKEELKGLVFCSDGQYSQISMDTGGNVCTNNTTVIQPTINAAYFPNAQNFTFWTSSPYLANKNGGYYINFNGEGLFAYDRGNNFYIRLVHDDKSTISNAQSTVADQTAADYLTSLKVTADKTVADYLTSLKAAAEKAASDYLTTLKIAAEKTAADYLTTLKAAADKNASTNATGYSKISNTGSVLPDTAILGTGTNDWACTKDNKTGLIWEVKTTDGGLRDWSQKYTNWFIGETGYGQATNSDYLTSAVNKQTMCGASNWRLPTNDELKGLILCSDGQYTVLGKDTSGIVCTSNTNVVQPTINTTYFPNTQSFAFWTSSIIAGFSNNAWYVNSYGGQNATYSKASSYYVRLVHDDKPIQNTTVADKTAADYLAGLKIAADKTAADYLTSLKSTADKTVADYLTTQKAAADKTAADYLATLKAAANNSTTTTSTTSSSIYVKISNTGATLPDSAQLGTGPNDWACTKDRATGLIWEVKATVDGLHDTIKTYTHYATSDFVNAVNQQSYCGSTKWRLPTLTELETLKTKSTIDWPLIDKIYFPNTQSDAYWSSTLVAFQNNTKAFLAYFGSTPYNNIGVYRDTYYYARLVHS